MATAKKLPSGQWRTLVYDYTDEHGKRHYESFTAKTKRESEHLAAEYAVTKKKKPDVLKVTVGKALDNYINIKSNVLSPSTIRGYKALRRNYYSDIQMLTLENLSQEVVQIWVNSLSTKMDAKTVKNAHGLLSAMLSVYFPSLTLHTALPKKEKEIPYIPTETDIQRIIEYFKRTDTEMLKAVYLAAFGTLRRSEICGLTGADITGNIIHIHSAVVMNDSAEWIRKNTKTASSDRYVTLPSFVIDVLPKSGAIVSITPSKISARFSSALKKLDIPHFRFHDLRHYSASIMHALGIPDQYIMQRGGWSSDGILKAVYRNTMDDYTERFNNQINSYFENATQNATQN
ncbi:MAG: site-specific integrase [Lachnospiraceae bacterium]|nr:site-specific integrase [Lachnospiraceae bacterium]MBP3477549.1 site-specific integrase [Lachnospiraceae bacterium]